MGLVIDTPKAIEIAQKFLEEHHTTVDLKSCVLEESTEEKIWIVTFDIGFLDEKIKKVKIDANSGSILGYQ